MAMTRRDRKTPERAVTPERPLISLQTSNRFGDSDEAFGGGGDRYEEAAKHGREAVRVWQETIPDELKPYCELQFEIRTHDHMNRYECFRRGLAELEEAGVPAELQVSDPHDEYVFDPDYVEKLTQEFSCIKGYTVTEGRFEHYSDYNVPRYAIPPNTRHTIDIINMAGRYGKYVLFSLQDLKILHVGANLLNQPLMDAIIEHHGLVIPINEHIGPRVITRQAATCGFWIAEIVDQWGVEPQSWWFENGRMIEPGVFGQIEPDNTRIMPPDLYRAMILLGASLGATVYNFEPFWDLFDYDNSHCWRNVICPTLLEVINRQLIPTRDQVREKMKTAYLYDEVNDINAFHQILQDVDWIGDKGHLARATYGVWERYLEHELIPNKSRYYYVPLLPPKTPMRVLAGFERVIRVNERDSEEAYQRLLDEHYPEPDDEGSAWITSVNGHTYVMQTHENLYERQTYSIQLPKPVTGLAAERTPEGIRLEWQRDPGASMYHVIRVEGDALPGPNGFSKTIWHTQDQEFADPELRAVGSAEYHGGLPNHGFVRPDPLPVLAGAASTAYVDESAKPDRTYTYTVTATTSTLAQREGTVNYLDFLVFSRTVSAPGEQVTVSPDGSVHARTVTDPPDTRPAKQEWYPTFEGAGDKHRDVAEEIVARIDLFKQAHDAADVQRVAELYSERYEDAAGNHYEHAIHAWKWWFFRNNAFTMLRQIRSWDFGDYDPDRKVRVRLFSLFRACRFDDQPFGYGFDGTVRIPRHAGEEVTYTWEREEGDWRIVATDPAVPNFDEMLWNSRGCDYRGIERLSD